MADDVQQQEDDQNLWRAVYTADRGWSEGTAFADHLSVAAPALAEVNGTLYCAHRGARQGREKQLPLRWTSFTPASLKPFADALEQARVPLPEGASEPEQQKWQETVTAAAEALDEARKWTPDAYVNWLHSSETPALVNDNGTVRMVFTGVEAMDDDHSEYSDQKVWATSLWETRLDHVDGSPKWAEPRRISVDSQMPLAPGLAVFNGAVHLVFVDPYSRFLQHLVRDAEGKWTPVSTPEAVSAYEAAEAAAWKKYEETKDAAHLDSGFKPPLPFRGESLDEDNEFARAAFDAHGWPGSVSLAVHDGRLHALYRGNPGYKYSEVFGDDIPDETYGPLVHAAYDGTAWNDARDAGPKNKEGFVADPYYSRRGGALAPYDGKLHTVFPSPDNKLRHGTWTKDAGWSEPVTLDSHDSGNSPALLPFRDGPAGAEREVLLLVHRGVDRYVPPKPPVPPAPPSLEDVEKRGTPVTGKLATAYGAGDWSRLEHRFTLTPATLKNGEQAIIVTFEAWAQYYWLWRWYRESYGGNYRPHLSVDFRLAEAGRLGSIVGHAQFSSTEGNGYWRFEKVFTGVKAGGSYEAALFTSNTEKTGGYWLGTKTDPDNPRYAISDETYTRVSNFRSSRAEITLPD
ncbi:hypothetical protein [Streptomyces sp. NPDC048606]|uniref:hypothetical protein n=1 Tax=Streptomyces sp. NPDC048606 TaxID=3154726 RepID=UPI0034489D84